MNNNYLTKLALILGASLIISALLVSGVFYKIKSMDDTLTVTGSAKKEVTADSAKWTGSFSRLVTVGDMKFGYSQMSKDLEAVKKFFSDNGVAEDSISPVFVEQQYKYDGSNGPTQYMLRQTVEVRSNDVKKITDLANNSKSLIDSGVIFSAQPVEYYYSKLADTRLELLGDAVKDAKNRADTIAKSGGKKVSSIKSVSVGVTQVTSIDSIDISDYGTYDTSNINKQVTITVKALFGLR